MDDEWDAESFQPPTLKTKGDKWDGEDEEEDVKDNWEDDDPEEEEKKDEEKAEELKTLPATKKKKTLADKILERENKEKELLARKIAAKEALKPETLKNLTHEEKLAEKLRQQRLQEEADLQVTKETFGVIETSESIDALQPTTQEEFNLLEEALIRKLQPLSSSVHYPTFIENLTRNIGAGLNVSNLKKIKLAVENLITEKTKAEKEKTKKGAAKSKPRVRMEGKNPEEIAAEREIKEAVKAMRAEENQAARANNLLIIGIPLKPDEDLVDIVCSLALKLEVKLKKDDIVLCQRSKVGVTDLRRHRKPDVIVAFKNRAIKLRLMNQIKNKIKRGEDPLCGSDINKNWPSHPIFLFEHLTEANRELYKTAKAKAAQFGWKFVWVKDCVIFARQNEDSEKFELSGIKDIDRVFLPSAQPQ